MTSLLDRTLGDLLRERAAEHPQRVLLRIDGESVTYGEMERRTAALAEGLGSIGVIAGENVAIWLQNSVDWVVTLFAVAARGARLVPFNTRFRAHELEYALRQSRAVALVTGDRFLRMEFMATVREIRPDPPEGTDASTEALPDLRHVICRSDAAEFGTVPFASLAGGSRVSAGDPPTVRPEDVACIMYTSGTTAFPKGAMIGHGALLENARQVCLAWDLRADDVMLSPFPFYHLAGLTNSLLTTMVAGGTIYSMSRWDVDEALHIIEAARCTRFIGPVTTETDLLDHPGLHAADLSSVRMAQATHHASVGRRIHEDLGWQISGVYGLTEASPNVCVGDLQDRVQVRIERGGRPFPGIEVRIVDPATGADVSAEDRGEILVRGWNVMQGYFDKPEETALAIDAAGWLHTGDIGELDRDGYLTFRGRYKDMIKCGGENVSSEEVEALLLDHPKVHQVQVLGVPDARKGEVPMAFVEVKAGKTCDEAEIIAYCRARIANFKVPRHVRFVEEWPLTHLGKIRKFELRRLVPDLIPPEGEDV